MTLPELAAMRLRLAPGLFITDPIAVADAATTRADLRIALAAARGHDLNTLDPASGKAVR